MRNSQRRDRMVITLISLLLFVILSPATSSAEINLDELAYGECTNTIKDGKKVKVCREELGGYKILPGDNENVPTLTSHQQTSAPPQSMACSDLEGNIYENGRDEELRKLAKLPEWNRYHDYVLGGLCDGAMEDLDRMVDSGYISITDVNAIAQVLGKKYVAKTRTENGKLYERIYKGLLQRDLCSACASTIAEEYIKRSDSILLQKVDLALAGNNAALEWLQTYPSNPPPEQAPSIWSTLTALSAMLLYFGSIVFFSLSVFSKRFKRWLKKCNARLLENNQRHKEIAIVMGVIIITTLVYSDSRTPEQKACAENWKNCTDNGQLINLSSYAHISTDCKIAATRQAKYGDPDFPSSPFQTYLKGRDYIDNGVAVLIEEGAKFQNVYGTKERSKVVCRYDLNAKEVTKVTILQD